MTVTLLEDFPQYTIDYTGIITKVTKNSTKLPHITTYFNPKEATLDGFCLKQISAVCNNRQKTHKGFVWKYC